MLPFSQLSGVWLCDPMDCSPPGSSVHGISQARILERIAISSSRGSSQPRNRTCVSCTGRQVLNCWATREVPLILVTWDKPTSGILLTDPYRWYSHHNSAGENSIFSEGQRRYTFVLKNMICFCFLRNQADMLQPLCWLRGKVCLHALLPLVLNLTSVSVLITTNLCLLL